MTKLRIGLDVTFYSDLSPDSTEPWAAKVVSVHGERANLVVWDTRGNMTPRLDVVESRGPQAGCFSREPQL